MKKSILLMVFAIFAFLSFGEDFEETKQPQSQNTQDEINIEQNKIEKNEINAEQGEQNAISSRTVSKINFNGLKKTKDSYLQPKYKKYIGKTKAEIDLHDLETELQGEGIFETISIQFSDSNSANETSLEIDVTEKITFIPLPFMMYSSSGIIAGAMVMDTNAFGVKDTLMLGGFYASTSITGMGMFAIPAIERVHPGMQIFTSVSKNYPKVKDIHDEKVLEFDNFAIDSTMSVFNKLGRFNTLGLAFAFKYLKNDSEDSFDSIGSATIASAGLTYSISMSDWNGFFMSTHSMNITSMFSKYFGTEDESELTSVSQTHSLSCSVQQPVFSPKVRFCAGLSGAFTKALDGKSAHIAEAKKRASAGVTILSGDFKTDAIFGGTLGFEAALLTFKFGLISAFANYEFVWADDFSEKISFSNFRDLHFCQGPSAGMRLYLSKIALPALSMAISYNASERYWQYAFSVGMSI